MKNHVQKEKIVILGGGYAGLQTALELHRKGYSAILIDKNSAHELLPELPHAISNRNLKTRIEFSKLIKNKSINLIQKEVIGFDLYKKEIKFVDQSIQEFDYLVIALGSNTNYFNIPGLRENSHGFITTKQVKEFNDLLESNFQKAKDFPVDSNEYKEFLSVIVGGGGLTGVEVAGELIHKMPKLAKQNGLNPDHVKIYLVEAQSGLLPGGDKKLSDKVTDFFHNQKLVESVLGVAVKEGFAGGVKLSDDRILKSKIVLWTGGIRGNILLEKGMVDEEGKENKWPLGRGFRIEVDEYFRVKGNPAVYAIGDNALYIDPKSGQPFPLNGQAAYKEGRAVAKYIVANIENREVPCEKIDLEGIMVSLGPLSGTGSVWKPLKLDLPVNMLSRVMKQLIELRYKLLNIRN
ncbi:MAG: FAD-dependent oxidoreductase [Aphanizomenon flos-aquae CP01]|nr:FAD-dependent oxidoreductase [Aphanizomenon flos-aquae CP01]